MKPLVRKPSKDQEIQDLYKTIGSHKNYRANQTNKWNKRLLHREEVKSH